MKEWAKLAPYNFVHAMRVPRAADLPRWQQAIETATAGLPFGRIPPTDLATDLDSHLEAELHRPFSSYDAPFRFFVVSTPSESHWFGATVDHWAADDFSIRRLLHRIYTVYCGKSLQSPELRLELESFARRRRFWREWSRFFRQVILLRRACRTPVADPMNFTVRTLRHALPEQALERGREFAKQCGGTLHDLFLAGVMQAFACAHDSPGTKRDAVAITSAMDMRQFVSESNRAGFGLFLSYFIVVEKRPRDISLERLVTRIAHTTRRIKGRPWIDSAGPALVLWRMSRSDRAKATFFLRGAPTVAGVSNVNLTGTWIDRSELIDYRRIGPAGPVVPMVLMITTFRGRVFIESTFRTSAFSTAQAEERIGDFVERVTTLA
ncbi:MAG: hypothetical protein ACJ8M1_00055 [Chthoniobacterales bacterium]